MHLNEASRAFIRNHPAWALFVLAFFLGSVPLALVATGLIPLAYSQLGALSASCAAFILVAVEGDKKGVAKLLRRGLVWRVGFRWWFTAIFYLAPAAAAALFINALVGGVAFDWNTLGPVYDVLPMIVVLTLLAGLGEEFGWRGYLLPRLQQQHSALAASLIIGFFHSLWHIPLFLVEGTAQFGWGQEVGFLPAFLGYSAFVTAWSIQLTWFFNNTKGSVLIIAVAHGAGNAWIGGYFDISGNAGIAGNNVLTVLMVIISLGVVAMTGHRSLSRYSSERI